MEKQFYNDRWLYLNEKTAHKKVSCTKITELKNLGRFLCKLICKWKNHVEKNCARFRRSKVTEL
jgi:hypothetical protein